MGRASPCPRCGAPRRGGKPCQSCADLRDPVPPRAPSASDLAVSTLPDFPVPRPASVREPHVALDDHDTDLALTPADSVASLEATLPSDYTSDSEPFEWAQEPGVRALIDPEALPPRLSIAPEPPAPSGPPRAFEPAPARAAAPIEIDAPIENETLDAAERTDRTSLPSIAELAITSQLAVVDAPIRAVSVAERQLERDRAQRSEALTKPDPPRQPRGASAPERRSSSTDPGSVPPPSQSDFPEPETDLELRALRIPSPAIEVLVPAPPSPRGDEPAEPPTVVPPSTPPPAGGFGSDWPVLGPKYRVLRRLGEGGLGAVYEAEHDNRRVAVKLLHRSAVDRVDLVERLRREHEAVAKVRHPAIVEVIAWDSAADGRPFVVMEKLEGEDLRARLRAKQKLPPDDSVAIGIQILEALIVTHALGVVHRDIKPENVFLSKTAAGEQVKLLDFGAARLRDAKSVTMEGALIGTPAYVSPEQIATAQVGEAADLYAAALVIYEAMTGVQPFAASSFGATLVKIIELQPDPPSAAGAGPSALRFDPLILRGLAKDPAERWPSALAFRDALRDATRTSGPPRSGWRSLFGRWSGSKS